MTRRARTPRSLFNLDIGTLATATAAVLAASALSAPALLASAPAAPPTGGPSTAAPDLGDLAPVPPAISGQELTDGRGGTPAASKDHADRPSHPPDSRPSLLCDANGHVLYTHGPIDVTIPDGDPGGILVGEFTIPQSCPTIGNVIFEIDITHTWIGDLRIDLLYDENNDGTYDAFAPILCRPGVDSCSDDGTFGCNGDLDGLYGFSDDATETIGEPGFGTCFDLHPPGCYQTDPIFANSLSDLDGFATGGTFAVFAIDFAAGDVGTIRSFSVWLQEDTVQSVPAEFPTIQAAVDAACDGDEIVIDPGTYDEDVVIPSKNLTVRGADPGSPPSITQLEIDPSEGTTVVLEDLDLSGLLALGALDLEVRSSTVQDMFTEADQVTVRSSAVGSLDGFFGSGLEVLDSDVQGLTASYVLVTARRSTFGFISLPTIEDCVIDSCHVTGTLQTGAPRPDPFSDDPANRLSDSQRRIGSMSVTNTTVEGDVNLAASAEACSVVDSWLGGDLNILSNQITVNRSGIEGAGFLLGFDRVEVDDATFFGSLLVQGPDVLAVRNSVVRGGIEAEGFVLGSSFEVSGCTAGGIDVFDHPSGGALVERNTVVYAPGGPATGIRVQSVGLPYTIRRNIVDGFATGVEVADPNAVAECNDVWNCSVSWIGIPDPTGTNGNISAAPLFCGADVFDYSLEDGSPCRPGNHPDGFDCGGVIGASDISCTASDVDGPATTQWNDGITAYPNPTQGGVTLHWQFGGSAPTTVEVFSVDGRKVWSRSFDEAAGSVLLDLRGGGNGVRPGVYFARATNATSTRVTRIHILR